MRTDGRTDRIDEAISRFSQFWERVYKQVRNACEVLVRKHSLKMATWKTGVEETGRRI